MSFNVQEKFENTDIDFNGEFIAVRHREGFEITPQGTEEFWRFLSRLCTKYACDRVLAEGQKPERRLDLVEAFQSGVQVAERIPDLWLAIFFENYRTDELSELFERTARNRGVHVRFFSSRPQAVKWLTSNPATCDSDME